ncbi:hypothetical protein [Cardinium endosymbiont of Sogatella furcifera]|uniref:hypothetical protein n=1 Tax=Cardinium endosymbiont of Sogatella furcifera TaxID=650378 RepID=UPI0013B45E0A|nr:hypothetical protein [Cardinium endosymbiont of Sogatella furcifera]
MLSTFWVSCDKHKKIAIKNGKPTKKQMEDGASDRLASDPQPGDGHMGSKNMDTNHTAADAQGQSNTPTGSMHASANPPNQSSEQQGELGKWAKRGKCIDKRKHEVQAGEKTRWQAATDLMRKAWKRIRNK